MINKEHEMCWKEERDKLDKDGAKKRAPIILVHQ